MFSENVGQVCPPNSEITKLEWRHPKTRNLLNRQLLSRVSAYCAKISGAGTMLWNCSTVLPAVPPLLRRLLLLIRLESYGMTRNVLPVKSVTGSVSFWSDKFTTAKSPCELWSIVARLLERGRRACDGVSADDPYTFFTEKVERIKSTTCGSAPPTFRPPPHGATFTEFAPLS